jgi:23S rRNA pseudouridine1911/1915/1917 synthase
MEEQWLDIFVPAHKGKERIDTFLTRELSQVSRSQIQKLIKEGFVTVNGKKIKANHLIHSAERISVFIPRSRPPEVTPENIPLDIVYEDDYIIVVNKRAGMVVHPAFGHYSGTLVNALLGHCTHLSSLNEPYRPGIVHRIDKDTSGLLVVAKVDRIHRDLAIQFSEKSVTRCYAAVVWGWFQRRSGTVETLLARSVRDRRKVKVAPVGKHAVTHYEVVEKYPMTSLLQLRLGTGRTHQIRVHLAHIDHPVFGDHTYSGRGGQLGGLNRAEKALAVELLKMMPRQALHAKTLGFIHPVTEQRLLFDSELPDDMEQLIDRLQEAGKGNIISY